MGQTLTLDHIHKPAGHQCVPNGDGSWSREGASGTGTGTGQWHWNGSCTEIANQSVIYLRAMRDALGLRNRYRYTWDDQHQYYLIAREDPTGVLTQSWYNRDGQLLRRQVNDQLTARNDYDGRWQTRIDNRGLRTRIETNRFEQPLHIHYPDGSSEHYQYDLRNGQPNRHTDRNGSVTTYSLDPHGNRLQAIEAQGTPEQRSTRWTYDSAGLVLSRTHEGDATTDTATTTWTWDADGNPITETDPEGHTTAYQYDRLGRVIKRTDPNGGQWTYQYDAAGNRLKATDPLGHTTQASYDALGHRLSRTDANGHTTTFRYDPRGRLTQTTDPEGHSQRYHYDLANRLIERTDPNGLSTTLSYNSNGHLARITDPAGNTISLDYQPDKAPFGQPTAIHYPTYSETLRYDLAGRVRERSQSYDNSDGEQTLTTQYRFDPAGNRIETTDPAGRISRSHYDALDRLTQQTDPDGSTVGYRYDNRDNLLAVTNRKQIVIRRYRYDHNDRKTQETWPGGQTTAYRYDPDGNLTQKTDAKGQITRHRYDSAGQLTETTYYPNDAQAGTQAGTQADTGLTEAGQPGKTVSYQYDPNGNLLSYNDGDTQGSYRYDPNDRQLSQTINYGPFQTSTETRYTPDGRKLSQTYPDGQTITYGYNTQTGQLYAVTLPGAGLISFQGYTWTAINQTTYPGVTVRTVEHDGLLRPTHIKVTDYDHTRTYLDYHYRYDSSGNITQKQTEHGDYRYGYDLQDRLTNVDNPDSGDLPDEHYTYDPAGNRTESAEHANWHYNAANQLQDYGDHRFAYDANGSTVEEQQNGATTRINVYNQENRLSEVKDGQGNTLAHYGYDPFGRRVWKETGGQKHYYLYSDEGLIAELDPQGHIEQKYGWMPDSDWGTQPLWTQYRGRWAFYQTDHLGTPWMLIDDFKRVVWEGRYQAFGAVEVLGEPLVRNLVRFPGQVEDGETGRYYNYFRYYDLGTGRYLTSDPIGLQGGPNAYAYVLNNPVSFIDPLGLYTEIIIWQPVGHTSSSFGHVSANVNGTNYSWGPGGWDTKYPDASDYANRQETFRSGVGQILNLTPEQEKILVACYAKYGGDYGAFSNNCGVPHKDCLQEALGTSVSDSFFPVNIGNDLLDSPYNGGSTFYPGPDRGFWDDGFWAR